MSAFPVVLLASASLWDASASAAAFATGDSCISHRCSYIDHTLEASLFQSQFSSSIAEETHEESPLSDVLVWPTPAPTQLEEHQGVQIVHEHGESSREMVRNKSNTFHRIRRLMLKSKKGHAVGRTDAVHASPPFWISRSAFPRTLLELQHRLQYLHQQHIAPHSSSPVLIAVSIAICIGALLVLCCFFGPAFGRLFSNHGDPRSESRRFVSDTPEFMTSPSEKNSVNSRPSPAAKQSYSQKRGPGGHISFYFGERRNGGTSRGKHLTFEGWLVVPEGTEWVVQLPRFEQDPIVIKDIKDVPLFYAQLGHDMVTNTKRIVFMDARDTHVGFVRQASPIALRILDRTEKEFGILNMDMRSASETGRQAGFVKASFLFEPSSLHGPRYYFRADSHMTKVQVTDKRNRLCATLEGGDSKPFRLCTVGENVDLGLIILCVLGMDWLMIDEGNSDVQAAIVPSLGRVGSIGH